MDEKRSILWHALPFVMAILLLTLVGATPASALFGRTKPVETQTVEGAPIAQNLEVSAYKGVPYVGEFKATDNEGDELTFVVVEQPRRGTLQVEGGAFSYTADKTGADSFTYAAEDSAGNRSATAAVKITVRTAKTAVTYADLEGSAVYTDALRLAEAGIFTGECVSGAYFFEPEATVSRSEFLAMAMAATGVTAAEATMTGFSDDAQIPTWAKGYASTALRAGVVQGVSTAEGAAFAAEEAVSVSEAAAILNRLLAVTDVRVEDCYADASTVPVWAAQAVANMASVSVIASGSFDAALLRTDVTRAQAAQMLSAAMTLAAGEDAGLFGFLR